MSELEHLQIVDQEMTQRAQHYLTQRTKFERSTPEEKATLRAGVLIKTLEAHALYSQLDPTFDLSQLREVFYFNVHPETGESEVYVRKIMTWKLPGSLATMSECLIDIQGTAYGAVEGETPVQLKIENDEEFADKDVIMLDYLLKRFISLHKHVIKDDDFKELFNEK